MKGGVIPNVGEVRGDLGVTGLGGEDFRAKVSGGKSSSSDEISKSLAKFLLEN